MDGLRDWPFHSSDALMFFPRLKTRDRLHGGVVEFPPGAAAIGALLREDENGSWQQMVESPLLRPSAAPAVWVDRLQRARLAQRGVNALRATRTPLREAVAACTLAGEFGKDADARLLAARRFELHLAASIEQGTGWVSVEGNTARSRERVCRQVESFLGVFAEAGMFAGTERNRHYFVICDERLNAPRQHAAGQFRLIFGFQSRHSPVRHAWLVEHDAQGSHTRAVSLNQLAAFEPGAGLDVG
jgi:hypothetical protein